MTVMTTLMIVMKSRAWVAQPARAAIAFCSLSLSPSRSPSIPSHLLFFIALSASRPSEVGNLAKETARHPRHPVHRDVTTTSRVMNLRPFFLPILLLLLFILPLIPPLRTLYTRSAHYVCTIWKYLIHSMPQALCVTVLQRVLFLIPSNILYTRAYSYSWLSNPTKFPTTLGAGSKLQKNDEQP